MAAYWKQDCLSYSISSLSVLRLSLTSLSHYSGVENVTFDVSLLFVGLSSVLSLHSLCLSSFPCPQLLSCDSDPN